jgi:hypothetical protein
MIPIFRFWSKFGYLRGWGRFPDRVHSVDVSRMHHEQNLFCVGGRPGAFSAGEGGWEGAGQTQLATAPAHAAGRPRPALE